MSLTSVARIQRRINRGSQPVAPSALELVPISDECPTCRQPVTPVMRRQIAAGQDAYLRLLEEKHREMTDARIAGLEEASRTRQAELMRQAKEKEELHRAALASHVEQVSALNSQLEAQRRHTDELIGVAVARIKADAERRLASVETRAEKERKKAVAAAVALKDKDVELLRRRVEAMRERVQRELHLAKARAEQQAAHQVKALQRQLAEAQRAARVSERAIRKELREDFKEHLDRKVRESLAREEAIAKEKAKAENDARVREEAHRLERDRLQKAVEDLKEQLQRQGTSPSDLGDGQQAAIADLLRKRFSEDEVKEVRRGEAGADILHEVSHKGERRGSILIESKNSTRWGGRAWIDKLLKDGRRCGADKLILVTPVFPANADPQMSGLFQSQGVHIVKPSLALEVATVLRNSVIEAHEGHSTARKRAEKEARALRYLTSDAFRRFRAEQEERMREDRLAIQSEERHHRDLWKARYTSVDKRQAGWHDFDAHIAAIFVD
jgi:hypothetical protein